MDERADLLQDLIAALSRYFGKDLAHDDVSFHLVGGDCEDEEIPHEALMDEWHPAKGGRHVFQVHFRHRAASSHRTHGLLRGKVETPKTAVLDVPQKNDRQIPTGGESVAPVNGSIADLHVQAMLASELQSDDPNSRDGAPPRKRMRSSLPIEPGLTGGKLDTEDSAVRTRRPSVKKSIEMQGGSAKGKTRKSHDLESTLQSSPTSHKQTAAKKLGAARKGDVTGAVSPTSEHNSAAKRKRTSLTAASYPATPIQTPRATTKGRVSKKDLMARIDFVFVEGTKGLFAPKKLPITNTLVSIGTDFQDVRKIAEDEVSKVLKKDQVTAKLCRSDKLSVTCSTQLYTRRGSAANNTVVLSADSVGTLADFVKQEHAISPFDFTMEVTLYLEKDGKRLIDVSAQVAELAKAAEVKDISEEEDGSVEGDTAGQRDSEEQETPPSEGTARYIRLGSTDWSDKLDPNEVPIDYALVAELNAAGTKVVDLLEVFTWDFGDFCIGDCNTAKVTLFRKDDYVYLPQYAGARTGKQLTERVELILKAGGVPPATTKRAAGMHGGKALDLNTTVPFQPAISYETFDPIEYDLSADIGSKGIDVVVEFVDCLPSDSTSNKERAAITFEKNAQYTFSATKDTAAKIVKWLLKEMRSWDATKTKQPSGAKKGKPERDTSALFCEPLKESWELELWVMPQRHGPQKLFRFPSGLEEDGGLLSQFLSQKRADKGERNLYMEAHVVPRRLEGE